MPRALFMIRTKLGDTLTTYASVRGFIDANPEWNTSLLVRRHYVPLFEGESGLRIIPFGGRLDMAKHLLYERIARPAYDVVAVAWGQGPSVRWLARLLPAKRRIHYQKTHADLYPERPAMPADPDLFDPGWRVARMVARDFPKPEALCVPSLARRYAATRREGEVIGVVPFADELRKNFDAHSLRVLLEALRAQHPSARLRIFFNPGDRGSGVIREVVLPENVDLKPFRALRDLVQEYLQISSWIGTDTGLFHLAVAMGIPATVFFGPTQPWKIVRPRQPNTRTVRLTALGEDHCEVKSCERPFCLHQAVATWCSAQSATDISHTPAACPLRPHAASALLPITERRDTA